MFVVIARESRPDAAYWPGRRFLAAVDAVVWPFALALLVLHQPGIEGLVRPAFVLASLSAVFRVLCAVFSNHRYHFTTWWCARLLALLLVVWATVKMSLPT